MTKKCGSTGSAYQHSTGKRVNSMGTRTKTPTGFIHLTNEGIERNVREAMRPGKSHRIPHEIVMRHKCIDRCHANAVRGGV